MLETKMLSFMKYTKDTHNNPPSDATLDKLVAAAKGLGATHCEIATVFGRPNWLEQSKRWADRIHNAGMSVTWRNASDVMEGVYGVTKAVGANRKSPQFYLDLAADSIKNNPTLFKDGDEWAIYPERTEGIWQDANSWIWPATSTAYADFFLQLATVSELAFASIGKSVKVCLSANNGSELISGWMDKRLTDKAGYVVIDHYVDSNPTKLANDLRDIKARYGKPIYLQETAPDRFTRPDTLKIKAYFDVLKSLVADGTLTRLGFWGGWVGTPEAIFNDDFSLNAQGQALKEFFGGLAPTPTPEPTPTPDLTQAVADLRTELDSQKKLNQIKQIAYDTTLTTVKRINKIKEVL